MTRAVGPVLVDLLRLALGGTMLYVGAEWLVKGAAGLALALRIAPSVVGVTVVAYATSAPELTVSVAAALEDKSSIALGNVIGSNIANLGLILGLTALIAPPRVGSGLIRRELPVLILSTVLPVVFLRDGAISRLEGIALLLGSCAFTFWMLRARHADGTTIALAPGSGDARSANRKLKLAALALLGLAALVSGGKVLVDGAVGLARAVGMSERVVGLTIVAIGTSLPELAASVVAALRGHSDLAIGNVIGSNIFNVLLILGATAVVHPVAVALSTFQIDLAVLGAMTLASVVALRTGRVVRRWEGALLLAGYVIFLVVLSVG